MWLFLSGCSPNSANVRLEGDRLIATNPWTTTLVFFLIGAAIITAGLLLGLKGGKKARRGAVFISIVGLIWLALTGLSVPFEENSVDSTQLIIAEGLLGRGVHAEVLLADLQEIEVYKARVSTRSGGRRGGRRRGTSIVTLVKLLMKDGETDSLLMSGTLREPLLGHFMKQAERQGVVINDRRAEFVE
ncbi:hypothetical protein [Adhaeretor mobilis]|uniref:Uncharacterized protein n=1 Tax=Adhaeretor mobilis TaxID=1930276 RepID=A0A517N060_9BACT|nr:hypothetical protein [Adhaeretor mobilis]QDT00520.1 hypothetical protein HG15A2_38580 [Adhaeretor mobilis]